MANRVLLDFPGIIVHGGGLHHLMWSSLSRAHANGAAANNRTASCICCCNGGKKCLWREFPVVPAPWRQRPSSVSLAFIHSPSQTFSGTFTVLLMWHLSDRNIQSATFGDPASPGLKGWSWRHKKSDSGDFSFSQEYLIKRRWILGIFQSTWGWLMVRQTVSSFSARRPTV